MRWTVALLALLFVGCSPVYWFQTPTPEGLNADQRRMRAQLAEVLRGQGFQNMGAYYRASGDLGCGREAPDRQTFQKSWRARAPTCSSTTVPSRRAAAAASPRPAAGIQPSRAQRGSPRFTALLADRFLRENGFAFSRR